MLAGFMNNCEIKWQQFNKESLLFWSGSVLFKQVLEAAMISPNNEVLPQKVTSASSPCSLLSDSAAASSIGFPALSISISVRDAVLQRCLGAKRWCHLNWSYYDSLNLVQLRELRSGCKWGPLVMAKKTPSVDSVIEESNENESVGVKKTTRSSKTKRATSRTEKKLTDESLEDPGLLVNNEDSWSTSSDDSKKKPRRTRKKDASGSTGAEKEKKEKKVRRRKEPKKEDVIMEEKCSEAKSSDQDEPSFIENVEEETEDDLELIKDDGEDISFTYAWPPLVCCFGSAQHAFVPSGRPANRLINYEIHERMRDTLWSPEDFVRAPGASAGSVAIALASLGGKVTFMGKLADDEYGQAMLYYMNVNNVQSSDTIS
ncbi:fructokinase-like 2, chloroplastic [Senna tora]|uniref:Fructokinase-like 2, chloroplastic n=1 Tax=Senna tora TaxID=362788 RepID=A0A834XE19_9FABA|nr:fructokinase-like 2, chloroplastic [Senna tora]